jgi:DNA polymerase III delta subunit
MPAHSYSDLLRALKKGELPPALYLHGSAEILKDEAVQSIVGTALDAAARELNFEQRGMADLDPESLHTLLETLPMFGGRRVVVLRGVEVLKKKPRLHEVLLAALARKHEDTLLILIETASVKDEWDKKRQPDPDLVRLTYSVSADELSPERTVGWLRHRGEAAGVTFAEGAAEHLAQSVGNDLSTLRSEIDKLSSLGSEKAVTIRQVEDIVGVRHGETANDWRNAVLEDDPAKALRLLGPVLMQRDSSGVKLVGMLGTALVGVSVARARLDRGERGGAIASGLIGLFKQARLWMISDWTGTARRWVEVAPNWPPARLRAALRATLAADQALKETRISDERDVLTDLVLALAAPKAAPGVSARPDTAAHGRTPAGV